MRRRWLLANGCKEALSAKEHSLQCILASLCSLPEMFEFFETGPTLRYVLYDQSVFFGAKAAGKECRFLQKRTAWAAVSIRVRIIPLNNVLDSGIECLF
jgi:hypothetical protein